MTWADLPRAEAVVAAVAHKQFQALGPGDLGPKLAGGGCFIDVKAAFDEQTLNNSGWRVWRL
jgi:UDP-N-acetyl-D-galactosamine dehydrogenase